MFDIRLMSGAVYIELQSGVCNGISHMEAGGEQSASSKSSFTFTEEDILAQLWVVSLACVLFT